MVRCCTRRARSSLTLVIPVMILAACGGAVTHTRTASAAGSRSTGSTSSGTPAAGTPRRAPARRAGLSVHARLAPWHLPVARYRTMAAATGGSVVLFGGLDAAGSTVNTVYRLDPRTGRVRPAGRLAAPTHGGAAVSVGRRVLVVGGAGPPVYNLVEGYDAARATARVVGHMPGPRADLGAAAVGDQIVVAGGFDGIGPLDSVLTTRDERHWRLVARLPQAVRYPAVAVVGDAVYLLGGLVSGGEYTGTFSRLVQRIDLATRQARVVGRLPTPYAHAMATARDGQVFVLGGSTPTGATNAILRFNPATRAVSRAGRLPEHVTDAGVATIGETTYLVGGLNGGPLTGICIVQIR